MSCETTIRLQDKKDYKDDESRFNIQHNQFYKWKSNVLWKRENNFPILNHFF